MAVNALLKQALLLEIEEKFDAAPFLMELHPEYTGVILYRGVFPDNKNSRFDYIDTLLSIAEDFTCCGFEFELDVKADKPNFQLVYHWRHNYEDKIL